MRWLDARIRSTIDFEEDSGPGLLRRTVEGALGELTQLPGSYWDWLKPWWEARANLGTLAAVTTAAVVLILVALARRNAESDTQFKEMTVLRACEVETESFPLNSGGVVYQFRTGDQARGDPTLSELSLMHLKGTEKGKSTTPRPHTKYYRIY